jgi:hypothetical protein
MYIVELPGGERLLQVTAALDTSGESGSVSTEEIVGLLAERILATLAG